MRIHRPKPVGRVSSLYERGLTSDDSLVKAAAEKLLFDQLAEQITTHEELDATLQRIPDETQRRLVLEQLKPRLNFIVKETTNESGDVIQRLGEREEGLGEEEGARAGAVSSS